MTPPFFELSFLGQPVLFHEAGYVNISQIARTADASFQDFLLSPEGDVRLGLVALCVNNEPHLIVELRPPEPPGRDNLASARAPSLFWAHHTVASEFLAWNGDDQLECWFNDECTDRCWADSVHPIWIALSIRVEKQLEQLELLHEQLNQGVRELKEHMRELLLTIEAERVANLLTDHASPLGTPSFNLLIEFTKVHAEWQAVLPAAPFFAM